MRKQVLSLVAGCALLASPVQAAGDTDPANAGATDAGAAIAGIFGTMFEAPPLSPEAAARLPAARQVVDQVFPPGTYALLMEKTLGGVPDGFLANLAAQSPNNVVARLTGLPEPDIADLGADTLTQALAILDPAHETRARTAMDITMQETAAIMGAMEPAYRDGLANAYAERFSTEQLADLAAFFATPSGSHYAAQSMLIFADPQVMAKMTAMLPLMLERMPQMMARVEAAMAALPPQRLFDSLTPEEQDRLASLLGRSHPDLAAAAAHAAAAAAAQEWGESGADHPGHADHD